jgi:mannose-1-phosphate guanylyltransferase
MDRGALNAPTQPAANSTKQPVAGIVLSAGLGTRLGELGHERPKALFPLCNVPLARWALALLQHHGISDVSFNLHHLGHLLRQELAPLASAELRLRFSEEPELLGTGGGVKAMAALAPTGTVIVVNGKLATDVNLAAVVEQHRRRAVLATMVLYPQPNAAAWGAIGINHESRVDRILSVARPGASVAQDLMFSGIHVLEPELIAAIPAGPCCIIRTAYQQLLQQGAPIGAFVHQGYFYEHSTPTRYLQGTFNLLGRSEPLPAAPGMTTGVAAAAEISHSAAIVPPVLIGAARVSAGARVGPFAALGDGATVGEGVHLSHAVVWPGAEVRRSAEWVIVSKRQMLAVERSADPMAAPR